MTPERWRRVQQVFLDASQLASSDLAAFLDAACTGDDDLRREVLSLLEAERNPTNSIDAAVAEVALEFAAEDRQREMAAHLGRRIGPYQVVRGIGRGGMGAVYEAIRADDEYQRSVAIKFMARGFDSREALARFRRERQILATLQHPNIAALLDGGATEEGQPYIVMEYVAGNPLISYCRRRQLPIVDRLELFRSVCAAVQHAHRMLVIHRDLKPGNVLVTAEGVPKLLDFGIAKLLSPDVITGSTPTTRTSMRILTPQYASPEQIRGEPLTTASDVYSLGVLLYETLTFTSPYKIAGRTQSEIERAVCETQPARLTSAPGLDLRTRRQLAGDLETIVATALRREPERRYSSAQQLSDDLQRYLKGFPVSARDDTLFYRARKLVRRNKLASAAIVLLILSIAAGWTATIREARRTRAQAQETRRLANALLFNLHAKIQDLPGATPVRENLVQTALEYLNKLAREASDDLSLHWDLAQAYEQVGDVQGDPAGANLGHFKEALSSYRTALRMVETVAGKRNDYDTLSCLAWLHYKCGDLEFRLAGVSEATRSFEQGVVVAQRLRDQSSDARSEDLLRNGFERLARAQVRAGATTAALASALKAADAADRASRDLSGASRGVRLARPRMLVGQMLWLKGDLQTAWQHYSQAVRWLEDAVHAHPDRLSYLQDLEEAYRRAGDLLGNPFYFHFGDFARAGQYYVKSLDVAERLAARDPQNAAAQAQLGTALRRVALISAESDPRRSSAAAQRATEILRKLLEASPADRTYRRDLANIHVVHARALSASKQHKRAAELLDEAVAIQGQLLRSEGSASAVREDMFDSVLMMARVRIETGATEAASERLSAALAMAREMVRRTREDLFAERCLAIALESVGDFHAALSRRGEARDRARHVSDATAAYREALSVWSRWHREKLAIPYSVHREKQVSRALATLRGRSG